jgi:hypothetical protein
VKKSHWLNTFVAVFLVIYISGGIYTLVQQILALPFPLSVFMDYNFYSQALARSLSGGDMYAIREIGPAYLYPPPALLFIDLLNHIPGITAQGALFAALDILMATTLVYQVCKQYSLSPEKSVLLLAISLSFAPFLVTAQLGQINMLTQFGLGLLFIFALTLPWLAGLGLALAIVTKMTPLFFLAYLLATKNFKVLRWTVFSLAGLAVLAALRYGLQPFLSYIDVFRGLTVIFPVGANSQALFARLLAYGLGTNLGMVQFGITIYLLMIILLSGWQTFRGGRPEALFIITALAMILSPNILWYHHYVFFLLPMLVWIGWQRKNNLVTIWCLTGMLITQFDYFLLTGGLLVHIFGHLSILIVFFQSANKLETIENTKNLPTVR